MKKFFTARLRIILVVAALAAIITVGCMLLWPGSASPLNNVVSLIMNPLKNGVTLFVEKSEQLYDYVFRYETIQEENNQLREQLADINADIRDSETYKAENERLREMLELKERHTDYELEIANVVSRGDLGYGSNITISKGSAAGLESGMCAITETGQVVGLITEVGTNWATITTILDTSSEIGAYIFGSGYTCIAQGDYDLMAEGQLKASYISTDATIRNSDQLLTQGSGDVYPAGLVIGTVADVGNDESSVAKYAVVQPTVEFDSIEQVFIIKSFDIND